MKESKHTPGPWVHNPTDEPQNADRHVRVDDGQWLRVIAKVKHGEKDNARANARLIAAAPDLLEVLERLIAWHENPSARVAHCCVCGQTYPDEAWMDARAAIRKATGEA